MRLVCDKCSSIYTIEDNLVGGRDFRVACKQCGTPIVVRGARQVSSLPPPSANALRASAPRVKLQSTSFAPQGGEAWFVSLDQQQQGPYSAVELARLLEQERITWATPVWREGMKAWRPARRDAVLVTAVAGARGYAGDTMRLSASRSFLAPEDTVVDVAPEIPHDTVVTTAAAVTEDLLSSASETKTLDARQLPDLRPSERPAAWNSPENQAFRAGLGLPDSREVQSSAAEPQEPASRTLADAFRSAPALMTHSGRPESTAEMPLLNRPVPQESWVPRAQSFWAVAGLAFAGGVLAAALYARFAVTGEVPKTTEVATTAPIQPAPKPAPVAAAKPPPVPVAPPQAVGPSRELPEPDELRAAVRNVAPDVKRCVLNPAQGVDVDIYLDGPSGRVRDVDVRSPQLPPGRVECVTHAVRKLQLPPFSRPELKLMHKFSW